MAHVRQQIRDAVASAVNGLTTTGSRVYTSRFYPMQAAELPGLIVYTRNETSVIDSMTRPRGSMRDLSVGVDAYVKANDGADDTADTICAEVEAALSADVTLGGLAKDMFLSSVSIDLNADGEKPAVIVSMTWTAQYRVLETNAEAAI